MQRWCIWVRFASFGSSGFAVDLVDLVVVEGHYHQCLWRYHCFETSKMMILFYGTLQHYFHLIEFPLVALSMWDRIWEQWQALG